MIVTGDGWGKKPKLRKFEKTHLNNPNSGDTV